MLPDIEGTWLGTLSYGPEYGYDIHGQTLDFEIVITKSPANDGTFTGVARDIKGLGVNPTKAHIEGFVEDNLISFTKLYEQQFNFTEDGGAERANKNIPIQYDARYNPDLGKYVGEWVIIEYVKDYSGFYQSYEATGLWEMRKVNLTKV
jgi:hypothetical protein